VSKLTTPLCTLVGCELPIVQAPLASTATVELVAAVCEAGGLGVVGSSPPSLQALA
jgi:NAD(P)H-dependent flavin oxidoreductase YrpB (nitropropane dioxygenase family)